MLNQEKLQGCNNKIFEVMDYLDTEVKRSGYQVIITSGKRSPEQNMAAGGIPKSDHVDGNAVDFMFSDPPIIWEHVSDLYQKVRDKVGVFAFVTKMEVVRGVINGQWANHIHFTVVDNGNTIEPIFFTGVYQ